MPKHYGVPETGGCPVCARVRGSRRFPSAVRAVRQPLNQSTETTTGPRGVIGTGVVLLTDASASSERLPQEPIRPVSRSVLLSKKIAVS
jgi:hypothetical protein